MTPYVWGVALGCSPNTGLVVGIRWKEPMMSDPTNAERYRRAHVELCWACVGDKRVQRVTSRQNGDHIATDILPCSTCNGRGYRITAIDALGGTGVGGNQ